MKECIRNVQIYESLQFDEENWKTGKLSNYRLK